MFSITLCVNVANVECTRNVCWCVLMNPWSFMYTCTSVNEPTGAHYAKIHTSPTPSTDIRMITVL